MIAGYVTVTVALLNGLPVTWCERCGMQFYILAKSLIVIPLWYNSWEKGEFIAINVNLIN